MADSEDAVQETWLRWQDVDLTAVREPRAYLLRAADGERVDAVMTRINMLRNPEKLCAIRV